jgi:hypothetical protein
MTDSSGPKFNAALPLCCYAPESGDLISLSLSFSNCNVGAVVIPGSENSEHEDEVRGCVWWGMCAERLAPLPSRGERIVTWARSASTTDTCTV